MFDRCRLWYLNIAQYPGISDDCSALLSRQGAFSMGISQWSGVVAAATLFVATAGCLPANAAPVSTVGMAVGSLTGTDPVGSKENRSLLGGDAIKYFIPLGDSNGIYGLGGNCSGHGFGTCSDTGDGGGTLKMFLRFSPISTTAPSMLTIKFEDLDLKRVNDPNGFVESLNIYRGATSLTGGWINNISSLLVDGDHDSQILNLVLNLPISDPLYLVLKFKAKSDFKGTNTAEFLRATITEIPQAPPVPTPLPGALVLMGTVLAGSYGVGMWRRRRTRAA
jgi:hypothetical protein